jgi:hypothetical protein
VLERYATKGTGLENPGAPPQDRTELSSLEGCIPMVGRRTRRQSLTARAPQVELLDLGSPSASKANVVAYDRHVLFTADDPAGATRHRAPGLISMTRRDEALVHEMPEELIGLVFAQADLVAYACDLGVGVYLVPSALALLDSPEHGSALVVGKLCRHYAPLPLVPPPTLRLPDRTTTRPCWRLPRTGRTSVRQNGTCLRLR